jgi:hypothetical protein
MDNTESTKRGFKSYKWLAPILLCAGLVFGLVKFFKYATRKTEQFPAQETAVELAQGIKQFRQEYGSWPVGEGEKHRSDATFLVNLLGNDTSVNKRGINFLKDIRMANRTPAAIGLHRSGDSGEIFDPWGNHFIIVIDHDNDGWVENPEGPSRHVGAKLNLPVAVVSPGRDGVLSGKNHEGKDATKDNWRSW